MLTLAPLALAQLPKGYGLWLNEDVPYIVQPEERPAFESLRTDEEREQFIIQWANQRCKKPGSNKPGWATEKGRTYIVFGSPDEIEVHPEQNNEQWFYKKIHGVGANVTIEFGPRRVRR